jgi:hypothetical protein
VIDGQTEVYGKHSRNFEGDSVEVDAMPSHVLRRLVGDAIEEWIDDDALHVTRAVEANEREWLESLTIGGACVTAAVYWNDPFRAWPYWADLADSEPDECSWHRSCKRPPAKGSHLCCVHKRQAGK